MDPNLTPDHLHGYNFLSHLYHVWPRGRVRGTRKTQQKGTEENDLFVSTNRKGETNDSVTAEKKGGKQHKTKERKTVKTV